MWWWICSECFWFYLPVTADLLTLEYLVLFLWLIFFFNQSSMLLSIVSTWKFLTGKFLKLDIFWEEYREIWIRNISASTTHILSWIFHENNSLFPSLSKNKCEPSKKFSPLFQWMALWWLSTVKNKTTLKSCQ